MQKYLSWAAIAVAFASPAFAQDTAPSSDEIVVTASRAASGANRDTLGASVTVITPAELETRQTRVVADVLRDVPGVALNRSGAVGGNTQVRLRGSEGNHTLVLIDGMEVSDPYIGEFDFATLIADDVAGVEVLRGQQSALYGSDAIGGVIQYITASGADASGVRGRVEYGSSNSIDGAIRAADVAGPLDYAFSAGYQSTDGTPTARGGNRDVSATNTALAGRVVYTLSDNARIRAVGRYTRTEADTNPQDFDFPPGPTYGFIVDGDGHDEFEGLYGLVSGELELLDGRWSHALTLQNVNATRDSFSLGSFSGGNDGSRLKASYVSSLRFGSKAVAQTITGALDFERERFQNTSPFLTPAQGLERQIEDVGAVAQYDVVVNRKLGLGAAVRRDNNDRFDDTTTYRVQGSYLFDTAIRVHAAAGSGVKNPGIFELFGFDPGSFIGNPNLKPERSEGWEAGVEQRFWNDRARIDVTYFDSKLKDDIFTTFTGPSFTASPANRTSESTQKGVEVGGEAQLGDQWRVNVAYTYLDAKENGLEEVRRPQNIASLNVAWRALSDQYGAYTSVRYNGEMQDNNFTLSGGPRAELSAFTLVNVGGDYRLSETFDLYARVENALDEDYEEIFTYRSPGRAAYIGVRAGF